MNKRTHFVEPAWRELARATDEMNEGCRGYWRLPRAKWRSFTCFGSHTINLATVRGPCALVGRASFALLICVASGRAGVDSGLPEVHDLLRATHSVRAMVTEARESGVKSGHTHREEALARLAETGTKLPRWALMHALAEEHERLGWQEDDAGRWHRKRAACLYALLLYPSNHASTHAVTNEADGIANAPRGGLAVQPDGDGECL